MAKRYVLFIADAGLSEGDRESFAALLDAKGLKARTVEVRGSPRALIVKTTNEVAEELKSEKGIEVRGRRVAAVLTSGAIGNLKKRAKEVAANGKVP